MLRRHIVTVVIACAALALGIVLGAGPLTALDHTMSAGHDQTAATTAEGTSEPGHLSDAAVDDFARTAAPGLIKNSLRGHRVAMVLLPGADSADAAALTRHIRLAGGKVAGMARVGDRMFEPTRRMYVDALTTALARRLGRSTQPSTYERAGEVLGTTLTHDSADGRDAADALSRGGLADRSGTRTPADLVLVLAGDPVEESILTPFVRGLDASTPGLTVASHTLPAGRAGAEQPLAVLRAADLGDVATVDGIETRIGRIAATLTLVRQITASGGDFGATGLGGLLPNR